MFLIAALPAVWCLHTLQKESLEVLQKGFHAVQVLQKDLCPPDTLVMFDTILSRCGSECPGEGGFASSLPARQPEVAPLAMTLLHFMTSSKSLGNRRENMLLLLGLA